MNILASDPRLGPLRESLSRKLATAKELETLTIEIEVLPNFDALSDNLTIRTSPAAYMNKKILVNERDFFVQTSEACAAIISHEIAHAIYERDNLSTHPIYSQADEEFIADLLAAKWGFAEELGDYRRAARDEDYVNILRHWQDEEVFIDHVNTWHIDWVAKRLIRDADRPHRRPIKV
jgi:hypothetical protein